MKHCIVSAGLSMVLVGCSALRPRVGYETLHRVTVNGPVAWLDPSGEKPKVVVLAAGGPSDDDDPAAPRWPDLTNETASMRMREALGLLGEFEIVEGTDVDEALNLLPIDEGADLAVVCRHLHEALGADAVIQCRLAVGGRMGIYFPPWVKSDAVWNIKYTIFDAKSGREVIQVDDAFYAGAHGLRYIRPGPVYETQRTLLVESLRHNLRQLRLLLPPMYGADEAVTEKESVGDLITSRP